MHVRPVRPQQAHVVHPVHHLVLGEVDADRVDDGAEGAGGVLVLEEELALPHPEVGLLVVPPLRDEEAAEQGIDVRRLDRLKGLRRLLRGLQLWLMDIFGKDR